MATQQKQSWLYVGSSALTGGELLKWSAKDQVDIAGLVTDKIVGTAAEAVAAGNVTAQNVGVYPLRTGETLQVIASAAITAGAFLSATTAGKVVTAAAKSATGNTTVSWYLGIANEAAAADGDVIEMICQVSEVNV